MLSKRKWDLRQEEVKRCHIIQGGRLRSFRRCRQALPKFDIQRSTTRRRRAAQRSDDCERVSIADAPDDTVLVGLYASGWTVYRVRADGEIAEVVAWAKSTIVANAAFRKLVEQYPNDEFLQKRKSWVENP